MVETIHKVALSELPPVPRNPLPYRRQVKAIRMFHSGLETLRDAGGSATPSLQSQSGRKYLEYAMPAPAEHVVVPGIWWTAQI